MVSKKTFDIFIIGGGPAGLSAALYAGRSGLDSAIIKKDKGALKNADKIENYFGVSGVPSGGELIETGLKQVRDIGVEVFDGEVFNISYEGDFVITTDIGEFTAKSVIIATGTVRKKVKIKGFDDYDGRGVSWCAICDSFFFRGKKVGVLGNGEYALHELSVLKDIVGEAVLVTNGGKFDSEINVPNDVKVYEEQIDSLYGDGKLEGIVFKNGTKLELDGIFMALGSAGAVELARKTGAETSGNSIVTNADMATNIPGLFAAGDCTGGIMQVSVAVGEGAKAALSAVKYIKSPIK